MIVIPRKVGESIVIGDDIILTVIEIRGDKIRFGIQVPAEMSLHRKEIYDLISGAATSQSEGLN